MKVRVLMKGADGRPEVAAVEHEGGEVVCRRSGNRWEPLYKLVVRREALPTDFTLPAKLEAALDAIGPEAAVDNEFDAKS
jgi:hypothetical protein